MGTIGSKNLIVEVAQGELGLSFSCLLIDRDGRGWELARGED